MNPTQTAFAAEERPPVVPSRFREALSYTVDDAMPDEFAVDLGAWLHAHRSELFRVGDVEGHVEFGWAMADLDDRAPDLFGPLRKRVVDACRSEVLRAVSVPPFELERVDMHASMHHHGGHRGWTVDVVGEDGPDPRRRLSWAYYVHSLPQMFTGGEMEFVDGTTVDPKHNRLHIWHPAQTQRVRRVECYSAHVLHGRWAIYGHVYGEPPKGWTDRLRELLGS